MRYGCGGIGFQAYFLLEVLGRVFLLCILVGGEALVGLLEERHVVVERFEVETEIAVDVARIVDGVSQVCAARQFRSTGPTISGTVFGIGHQPVESGYLVERKFPGEVEILLIGEGTSQVLDAGPHRVFPGRIAVGIEVFVHGGVRLFHLSVGAG